MALFVTIAAAFTTRSNALGQTGDYASRAAEAVEIYAQAKPSRPDFPKDAMPIYAARLQMKMDVEGTLSAVDRMIDAASKARPDPFNLHALIHGYFVCRDSYPMPLRAKVRQFGANWDYTKPIGVSLNYELMRDGGGWLAAQEWPDLKDKAGNDAPRIKQLCSGRLLQNFAGITAHNASEYEAPLYYGTDLMAVRMLAEFAQDPALQQAAQLTLEWMLIQTGAHWHHGYYITSSGRAKYWGSNNLSPDNPGATTGMAYLLFGGDRPARLVGVPQCYWLAHPGRALPLSWLPGWQAALPEQRTVQASVIWPSHKIFVRKMAWMTTGYGLASERDDRTPADSYLFKESRRTMLKWVSDKPDSSFTVLQDSRRRPREKIANAFAYGENPYAQVMQSEGTLIGLYDVPPDYGFATLRAPFTQSGAIVLRQERDGWIVCHGGSVLFAFRSLQPAHWAKGSTRDHLDLYECDEPRNGWIVETATLASFAGGGAEKELERFATALNLKTKVTFDHSSTPLRLTFTNLAGHTLDLTWHQPGAPYSDQCLVDGKTLDYESYPLLRAPGCEQQLNGPLMLTIADGSHRSYDFKKWKVTVTR